MTDDAVVFLLHTWQETWHILHCDKGNVETVAETDETGSLVRSINIECASEEIGLVGNESHRTSCHTSKTYDDILGELRLNLKEVLLVADGFDDIANVIGNIGVRRHYVVQLMADAVDLICDRMYRSVFHVVGGDEAYEFTDSHQRLLIAVTDEVAYTAH